MLELGRVLAVHPESHSVDLVLQSDGRKFYGVRVVTLTGSSDTGVVDLPVPELGDGKDPASAPLGPREQIAVVGFFAEFPIVLGFLFPQVSQLMFGDVNNRIHRHSSDVYSVMTPEGDVVLAHPSGTYLRIGEDMTRPDLAGKDFDKLWKISRNTKRKPGIRVAVAYVDGKEIKETASLVIAPDGKVTLTAAHVTVDTGEAHFTGDIKADGDVSDKNGSMQEMRDTYNKHTHGETGGTTRKPDQEMS